MSQESKDAAEARVLKWTDIKEKESAIENQVIAEGFEKCVASISLGDDNPKDIENTIQKKNNTITTQIAVKAEDMTEEQANKIKNIVQRVDKNIQAKDIVVIPIR